MKCPVCPDATLTMSDRQGIEIDYCPQCRGVWLDRGELDKIIERTSADMAPAQQSQQPPPMPQQQPRGYPPSHGYDQYRHKKRKSLLDDLFDF